MSFLWRSRTDLCGEKKVIKINYLKLDYTKIIRISLAGIVFRPADAIVPFSQRWLEGFSNFQKIVRGKVSGFTRKIFLWLAGYPIYRKKPVKS